jgi:hypothetical protein
MTFKTPLSRFFDFLGFLRQWDKHLSVGGPVQDLSNFQMAPIPILSDLTCSTHSPHDIWKNDHNLPIGHVKRVIRVLGECSLGFLLVFD